MDSGCGGTVPRARGNVDEVARTGVVQIELPFASPHGHVFSVTWSPAARQDILELRRRKCNKRGIAEEIAPWLICPASPARASLTRVYLAPP
jgi:hypothetical protein